MQRLRPFFPEVTPAQWDLLIRMSALHREWNAKINLVSRKDIENLEWHHYAPCIAAVKLLRLEAGATLLDVGTGGGFPGLILAALYPQAHFTLADSVGKKITVVADIARRLGLRNVEARNVRVEILNRSYDFVTGRAVTSLPGFVQLVKPRVRAGAKHTPANGIVYWKGGSLADEEAALGLAPARVLSLEETLGDVYFKDKYIVHYPQPDLGRAVAPLSEGF
ncbi:16S rRNA (guanine(527)-N(7))-methyltransferase RsmG [Geminisphaera colitermitum]|uniref:16S rRNA (guanine(527)-N(7))-methyltransferase RsmG n=1 Tax=Geminisphaera colitermitum TaxID=1148786 RepID=UPI000158CFDB|nr:16S rRNA (guanine(527)-N(7))-methyltransferase RsmG [Geminisphaera colitermitum]